MGWFSRTLVFTAIAFVGAGLFAVKAPYLQLAARLASSQIDGRVIPVTEMGPVPFQEKTVSTRCGDVVLDIPQRATIAPRSPDGLGLCLELDGLRLNLLRPRHVGDRADAADGLAGSTGGDEISRRVHLCSTSARDLSFWMNAAQVESLQKRLEARPLFCLGAERIEVVRGKGLSGLLLMWKSERGLCMWFEYTSADNRIQGAASLVVDRDSPELMQSARAMVRSFRIEPG